jgi:hypothetical protein
MGIAIGRGVGSSLTGQGQGVLDRVTFTPMMNGADKGIVATVGF